MCGYKGLNYSSPTLSSAMSNLTPAFTFILAVFFRMEKASLGKLQHSSQNHGHFGINISCTGSGSLQGPYNFIHSIYIRKKKKGYWRATTYSSVPLTHVMKTYPAEIVLIFLFNLCGTIISAPVCLMAETNLSAWRLRPGMALVTIICSRSLGSSFSSLVHTWGLHLKGPVFISIFKPSSIAIAAAFSVIFLGDTLTRGSVVGAIILSVGFYAVIWGKAKEEEMSEDCRFESSRALPIATRKPLCWKPQS